jgi:hypothetical protein
VIGSPAIAAFIAQAAFWVLLAGGLVFGGLRVRSAVIFAVLYFAGRYGLSSLFAYDLSTSYVAVLDIALVLAIFKGDVRLT